jgi:preprotein translocase SecE subunit
VPGDEGTVGPDPLEPSDPTAVPGPLTHAAPDVELAEAQLALGAPDLNGDEDEIPDEEELDELAAEAGSPGPRDSGERAGNGGRGGRGGGAGAVAVPSPGASERQASVLHRLITFLQGSWAELQRVQWPDRRQVVQATSVVIGFVIVAGVFLGVADTIASHLMDWILK